MPDVVVIGGGVVGLSATTYLARAGASVTLCERGDLYQEASSKNLGILIELDVPSGAGRDLLRRGREAFSTLSDELGVDIGLKRRGAVTFGRTAEGDAAHFQRVHDDNAAEVDLEILDRAQLRELVPALSESFDCGLYAPGEAMVDNRLVCQAFAREAVRHGAELRRGSEVVAIETDGDAVTGVRTRGGATIRADAVILAAGLGSDHLAGTAGVRLPELITVHAEVMLTRPVVPLLGPTLYNRRHLVPSAEPGLLDFIVAAQGTDGRVFAGGAGMGGADGEQVTVRGLAAVGSLLAETIPALADVAIERVWGGMAAHPADGLPLVGRVPECEGLLLAIGAFNTAGPAVGQMVTDLARGEHPRFEAELSPTRPSVTGTHGLDLAGVSLRDRADGRV